MTHEKAHTLLFRPLSTQPLVDLAIFFKTPFRSPCYRGDPLLPQVIFFLLPTYLRRALQCFLFLILNHVRGQGVCSISRIFGIFNDEVLS